MTYVKDFALCIVIAMLLLFVGDQLSSSFFDLIENSFFEVVFAIFAINIASSALIAQLINSITERTGHPLSRSRNIVLVELRIQAVMLLISIALVITLRADIKEGSVLYFLNEKIKYCSKLGLLAIYIYFIWLTYELGKNLFTVLNVKLPNGKSGKEN